MVRHLDHLPGTFFGPSNLVELLRHRAGCQAEDVAFTYLVDGENEQVRLSYRELDRQARAIGAWLESLDLAGQRALLLYPAGWSLLPRFSAVSTRGWWRFRFIRPAETAPWPASRQSPTTPMPRWP